MICPRLSSLTQISKASLLFGLISAWLAGVRVAGPSHAPIVEPWAGSGIYDFPILEALVIGGVFFLVGERGVERVCGVWVWRWKIRLWVGGGADAFQIVF